MNEVRRWLPRAAFAALVVAVIAVFTLVEQASPLLLPTALLVCAVVAIAGMVTDSGGADPPDWTVPAEFVRHVDRAGQRPGRSTSGCWRTT